MPKYEIDDPYIPPVRRSIVQVWHPLRKRNFEVDKEELPRLIKMGLIMSCSCGNDRDHSTHNPCDNPPTDEVYPSKYSYCL